MIESKWPHKVVIRHHYQAFFQYDRYTTKDLPGTAFIRGRKNEQKNGRALLLYLSVTLRRRTITKQEAHLSLYRLPNFHMPILEPLHRKCSNKSQFTYSILIIYIQIVQNIPNQSVQIH